MLGENGKKVHAINAGGMNGEEPAWYAGKWTKPRIGSKWTLRRNKGAIMWGGLGSELTFRELNKDIWHGMPRNYQEE